MTSFQHKFLSPVNIWDSVNDLPVHRVSLSEHFFLFTSSFAYGVPCGGEIYLALLMFLYYFLLDSYYWVFHWTWFLVWRCLTLRHLWGGFCRRCWGWYCSLLFLMLGYSAVILLLVSRIDRLTWSSRRAMQAIDLVFI